MVKQCTTIQHTKISSQYLFGLSTTGSHFLVFYFGYFHTVQCLFLVQCINPGYYRVTSNVSFRIDIILVVFSARLAIGVPPASLWDLVSSSNCGWTGCINIMSKYFSVVFNFFDRDLVIITNHQVYS